MKKICFSLVLVAGLACLGEVSAEFAPKAFNVEIDTRFVETGRAALEAAGYFDTNRVDAAVLQERLMARQDAKLLESVRVVARPGEEAVSKQVVEYIYPTDYEVQLSRLPAGCVTLPCNDAVSGTNSCHCVLGTVEPQSFTMREVGAIVQVTPTVTDGVDLIDLKFRADFVGEPEWKNYGAKGMWEGAVAYELPMEQPFFPLRAYVDTKASVRPGHTLVFGGMTDSRRANEDKFVLVFVSARLVACDDGKCVPPTRRSNLAKPAMERDDAKLIEFDIRYISADSKTLSEVGYFSANRVNAAVLQDRLMANGGAKLLESPRLVTRPGEETELKGVLEYLYPTDYEVIHAEWSQTVGTNTISGIDSAGAAVEPQSFAIREVGTIVKITQSLTDDGNLIDIELNAQLIGEPEWKDYGAKAKWKGAATCDLLMEQPFFPVRATTDAKISMRPGATYVFGGGADRRKGDEDKFVFIFVTPRLIDP